MIVLTLCALTASSCGGSSSGARRPTSTRPSSSATQPSIDAGAGLLAAARRAVVEHHRLSVRLLWTNDVPTRPRWVAGVALQALRSAARDRRNRGVRVRLLHEDFRILSLKLDPSYTSATAVVLDRQTGALYENGKRMPRQVRLNEHAQIELRRVGMTMRFVVWKVALVK
jgi:hypothetical protein